MIRGSNSATSSAGTGDVRRSSPRTVERRARNLEAIKGVAWEQLAAGGPGALSLNAIGRRLGMTGPAVYRYVAGRDELLTELLVEAYAQLGDVLEAARTGRSPRQRLKGVGRAYRRWARDRPEAYELVFGTPVPGYAAPVEVTTPVAERALAVQIAAWVEVLRDAGVTRRVESRASDLAVTGWCRLHGFVSLELEGHLDALVDDPDRRFELELDDLLALVPSGRRDRSSTAATRER